MLIKESGLSRTTLQGQIVLLTGAGGGIGFEAARALCWLGANVIIAEIDKKKGEYAERQINQELGSALAEFYEVDISVESQIVRLMDHVLNKYGFIDILFHNATWTPMGAVDQVPVRSWDMSYAVNFRAPLLMTQLLLPEMKKRNRGIVVFVPSSGAAPYMGAYEVFKTAQVELANTLTGELEGTNICVYSIGPGLVKTETAVKSIATISSLMGISSDEFYAMNETHMLSAEEAGTGFALSVVFADKYNGQEIGSIQALMDGGVIKTSEKDANTPLNIDNDKEFFSLIQKVSGTFFEQYDGWQQRNVFERQWVLRDFKKTMGDSADQFKDKMHRMVSLASGHDLDALPDYKENLAKLIAYYKHQQKLLQGFEKNPQKLQENMEILQG